MPDVEALLNLSSARHSHLCPRQILGVRMALAGAAALQMEVPCEGKDLLVIAETDGCFVDGVEAAAGVSVGRRTLRIEDYGKVAATFVKVKTGQAVRLAPRPDIRQRAWSCAPGESRHYFAQLIGYQMMLDEELFTTTAVTIIPGIERLISRPGVRVNCCVCGEEIINEREVVFQGQIYCQPCLGVCYYQPNDEDRCEAVRVEANLSQLQVLES